MVMLATVSATFPVLDSVTRCELLVEFTMTAAKVSVAGETAATAAGPVPVPLKVAFCALPVGLSLATKASPG